MLLTKTAKVKWGNKNKKWYEDRGYIFTKYRDEFEVKIEDLTITSDQLVEYRCDYCLENGIDDNIIISWRAYNLHKKDKVNKDACMKHSKKKKDEIDKICPYPKETKLTKEEIKIKYLELYYKIGIVPKTKHIIAEHKNNIKFPSLRDIQNEFGTLNNLKKCCAVSTRQNIFTETQLLEYLTNYIDKNGIPKNKRKAFNNKNGLPSYKVYSQAFGDNLSYIIELCGFNLTDDDKYQLNIRGKKSNLSKEEAIKKIYNMQSKLDRPLMYDDFRNPNKDSIGLVDVKKYFGTINKMKKELGLKIIQEDMIGRQKTLEECKEDIIHLCEHINKTENRKIILTSDTKKIDGMLDYNTIKKYFDQHNEKIRDFINSIGFELQKEGSGLNHIFKDGEKVKSKYELSFSKYLRDNLKLNYNIDYSRDVRYNKFINGYKGLLDCDYIINYNNRIIYIEIAGLLRDLQKYFYNNQEINSKTKEHYRIKLMNKENMLKQNNLEYYILFPINKNYESVLDFDFINRIFYE